jgi:hypothetical protein
MALAAAETLQVPMPIASLVRDHFLSGLARGEGDSDWAALARTAGDSAQQPIPHCSPKPCTIL